jgi:hypothetical protein
MGGPSYSRIRETLTSLAGAGERYGYAIQQFMDTDDTWLATWANDRLYVIVQAAETASQPVRTLVDVHAGGAYGASPAPGLFQSLATATWRYDFGGPWARVLDDQSVAYGWRSRLPSDLFGEGDNRDAFGFVVAMIDEFGAVAGNLADELIPLYGGRASRANDPSAFGALIAGVLPPNE